jgi:hypothetical protein
MKIIKLEETTDEKGYLHLTIPAEVSSCKTEVIVIINPISGKKPTYDFSDIAGKLKWEGDPIEVQKALRAEWS